MTGSAERLGATTIALHWLIAIAIIGMLGVGLYLDDMDEGPAYDWLLGLHKAAGVLVLGAAFMRFFYRMHRGFPQPTPGVTMPASHAKLARGTHWLLLLATLVMPLSGVLGSTAGGYPVDVFGLFVIPASESPDDSLSSLAFVIHGLCANLLMIAILLHVGGALKHHFKDKDATLRRMYGLTTKHE